MMATTDIVFFCKSLIQMIVIHFHCWASHFMVLGGMREERWEMRDRGMAESPTHLKHLLSAGFLGSGNLPLCSENANKLLNYDF
jgi:hypothetical protein